MLTSHYNRLRNTQSSLIWGYINLWRTLDDSCFTPRVRDTLDLTVFQFNASENISKIINIHKHTPKMATTWLQRSPLSDCAIEPGKSNDRHGYMICGPHTQQHIPSVFKNYPVLMLQPYADRLVLFILLHYNTISN